MKPINADRQVTTPYPPKESMAPLPLPAHGFLSLRTKFVLFFSLILVIACSTLSWYYVEERREAMTNNLQQLGTILLTSVVDNADFRYAGLVAEDRATLQQFIDSLVAVQDVVYVVITRSDGTVLAQYSKGARQSSASLVRSVNHPLYPDNQIAKQLFQSSSTAPQITRSAHLTYTRRSICMGGTGVRLCHAGAANGKRKHLASTFLSSAGGRAHQLIPDAVGTRLRCRPNRIDQRTPAIRTRRDDQ